MAGKHKGEGSKLEPFTPPKQKNQDDGDGGGGKHGSGDGTKGK